MGDVNGGGGDRMWTWQEDKQFENALAEIPEDCPDRWERIAAVTGTRTAAEVEQHYAVLLADVAAIEAGLIEPPEYNKKVVPKGKSAGRPWTEKEHELFLEGLEEYGKGDWKSISRRKVVTRNPTQVASHAQKYYQRIERQLLKRTRKSIFDCPKPN